MTGSAADTPTREFASPETTLDATRPVFESPLRTPRGRTTIAPLVAEKIARRAAGETDGVEGVAGTGLSRLLPWVHDDRPADADATIDSQRDAVVLELTISVRYPEPVGEVTRRVREHVVERVTSCTGLRVKAVEITVTDFVASRATPRRRVV